MPLLDEMPSSGDAENSAREQFRKNVKQLLAELKEDVKGLGKRLARESSFQDANGDINIANVSFVINELYGAGKESFNDRIVALENNLGSSSHTREFSVAAVVNAVTTLKAEIVAMLQTVIDQEKNDKIIIAVPIADDIPKAKHHVLDTFFKPKREPKLENKEVPSHPGLIDLLETGLKNIDRHWVVIDANKKVALNLAPAAVEEDRSNVFVTRRY